MKVYKHEKKELAIAIGVTNEDVEKFFEKVSDTGLHLQEKLKDRMTQSAIVEEIERDTNFLEKEEKEKRLRILIMLALQGMRKSASIEIDPGTLLRALAKSIGDSSSIKVEEITPSEDAEKEIESVLSKINDKMKGGLH